MRYEIGLDVGYLVVRISYLGGHPLSHADRVTAPPEGEPREGAEEDVGDPSSLRSSG